MVIWTRVYNLHLFRKTSPYDTIYCAIYCAIYKAIIESSCDACLTAPKCLWFFEL
jgi:hypothetical protein